MDENHSMHTDPFLTLSKFPNSLSIQHKVAHISTTGFILKLFPSLPRPEGVMDAKLKLKHQMQEFRRFSLRALISYLEGP